MFVAYPLIPLVGVMAAGYALGAVYGWESDRRQKMLIRLGVSGYRPVCRLACDKYLR